MKETDFHFELKVSANNCADATSRLTAHLGSFLGVTSATVVASNLRVDLRVGVNVADSTEAKKLHRKIMKAIIADRDFAILQVRTVLTDIF